MTLEQFLRREKITATEFARMCDLPPSTITRLISGDRSPRMELLQRIHDATGGAVTPNDFLKSQIQEAAAESDEAAA